MVSIKKIVNALRFLSIDAINNANSGHPGAPMGIADIAEVLWRDYMKHNPCNPKWINRDRFILSNGHASILLYSILHLTGYNISIEEIKKFRKINSKTPGHPECFNTQGIEITTGPLGQGIANAVGMAIGERTLSNQFNKLNFKIINHYIYLFMGDGCLMEGISHEACSLAGTLKLGKLIAFYDNNGISIDGKIKNYFRDDTAVRFESYGWHVIKNINGHDRYSIKLAIKNARNIKNKPSIIICNTIIAFGCPSKSGTPESHGTPLSAKEIEDTRKKLNWKYKPFVIPKNIYLSWNATKTGKKREHKWNKKFKIYKKQFPDLAKELIRRIYCNLPINWKKYIKSIIKNIENNKNKLSGRKSSQNFLELIGPILPELIGGSADLSNSNLTMWSKSKSILKNHDGNYIHYGVREFGMTAIANGISKYGGFIPYTSTFLVFSDYAINAIRMAALMKCHHIMIYTHDSIGLGEDGPTHQPIEQLSHLRMIPNLSTWRPCDQLETFISWKFAIERNTGPTAIVLSRQNLNYQKRKKNQIINISRGGYIIKDCKCIPNLIIIATGSEVNLAINSYNYLKCIGYNVRVVSMPSTDTFDLQDKNYKEFIFPKKVKSIIAIEAGISDFWFKYTGLNGSIIGIKTFGKSGSSKELFNLFKFNLKHVIREAKKLLINNL
ncbi:MAG: transketolase [Candidatus Makana argininalis]